MADPVTAALVASAVVGSAGALQEGRVARAEGEAAQRVSEYNASVAEQEAKATRARTRFEQRRQSQQAQRIKGSQRAALATSGAQIGTGTPLDLQVEQANELELENLLIGYEGRQAERRLQSQAGLDRTQGQIYRQRGRNEQAAARIGAGATLLQGLGTAKYYGKSK